MKADGEVFCEVVVSFVTGRVTDVVTCGVVVGNAVVVVRNNVCVVVGKSLTTKGPMVQFPWKSGNAELIILHVISLPSCSARTKKEYTRSVKSASWLICTNGIFSTNPDGVSRVQVALTTGLPVCEAHVSRTRAPSVKFCTSTSLSH